MFTFFRRKHARSSFIPGDTSPLPSPPTPDQFWRHIRLGPENACWPWIGPRTGGGHTPYVPLGDRPAAYKTVQDPHTLIYRLVRELPVTSRTFVSRTCGTSDCVNPAHLIKGRKERRSYA